MYHWFRIRVLCFIVQSWQKDFQPAFWKNRVFCFSCILNNKWMKTESLYQNKIQFFWRILIRQRWMIEICYQTPEILLKKHQKVLCTMCGKLLRCRSLLQNCKKLFVLQTLLVSLVFIALFLSQFQYFAFYCCAVWVLILRFLLLCPDVFSLLSFK
jgi:hypothetical protein